MVDIVSLLPPSGTRKSVSVPRLLAVICTLDLGGEVPANLERRGGRLRLRFRVDSADGQTIQRRSLPLPDDPDAEEAVRAALRRNAAVRLNATSAYHAARQAEHEARARVAAAGWRLEKAALGRYGGSRRQRRRLRQAVAFAINRGLEEVADLTARLTNRERDSGLPMAAVPVRDSEAIHVPSHGTSGDTEWRATVPDDRPLRYWVRGSERLDFHDFWLDHPRTSLEFSPPSMPEVGARPPAVIAVREPPPDSPPDWRWRLMQAHPEAMTTPGADEAMAVLGDEFLAHWIRPCVRCDKRFSSLAPMWYAEYGDALKLYWEDRHPVPAPNTRMMVEMHLLGDPPIGNVFRDDPHYPKNEIAFWIYAMLFWDVGTRLDDTAWVARHVFAPLLGDEARAHELTWRLVAYHLGGHAAEHCWFLMRAFEPLPPGLVALTKRSCEEALYLHRLHRLGLGRPQDAVRRTQWMATPLVTRGEASVATVAEKNAVEKGNDPELRFPLAAMKRLTAEAKLRETLLRAEHTELARMAALLTGAKSA